VTEGVQDRRLLIDLEWKAQLMVVESDVEAEQASEDAKRDLAVDGDRASCLVRRTGFDGPSWVCVKIPRALARSV
jgi:hypothetical protein